VVKQVIKFESRFTVGPAPAREVNLNSAICPAKEETAGKAKVFDGGSGGVACSPCQHNMSALTGNRGAAFAPRYFSWLNGLNVWSAAMNLQISERGYQEIGCKNSTHLLVRRLTRL
jgi:hypothetical protein